MLAVIASIAGWASTFLAIAILVVVIVAAVRWEWHSRIEDAVLRERRRVSAHLRKQAVVAETVSKCRYLSERSQAEERYASAVLDETAWEIDTLAHHADVKS